MTDEELNTMDMRRLLGRSGAREAEEALSDAADLMDEVRRLRAELAAEREACALVLDALAAGVRWHETGDARVDAARRRGAETTRAAYEQGARSIRARGGV